jgi:hypothetical protein
MSELLYEKKDGIAILTLNRPERKNALTPQMMVRLAEAWRDFRDDDAARVAILTGAGDTFTAGRGPRAADSAAHPRAQADDDWDRRLLEQDAVQTAVLRRFRAVQAGDRRSGRGRAGRRLRDRTATDLRLATPEASFGLSKRSAGSCPAPARWRGSPADPVLRGDADHAAGRRDPCGRGAGSARERGRPARATAAARARAGRSSRRTGRSRCARSRKPVLRSGGRPLEEAFDIEDECARVVMRRGRARRAARVHGEAPGALRRR